MFNKVSIIITMTTVTIILIAVFLHNFNFLEAGLDSFDTNKDSNTRKSTLQLLSQLTEAPEDFNDFRSLFLDPFLKVRDVFSDGHKEVQKHIIDHFTSLNWSVEEDSFTETNTPYGVINFTNIIATTSYPATKYLVLACHYDSKYYTKERFIGATDSAVPCAILFDIAKSLTPYLNRYPSSKYGLKMIFFDGEEALKEWTSTDSIYGARHLATKMENNKVKVSVDREINELQQISLFVLLDLIGHKETQFLNIVKATTKQFKLFKDIESSLKSQGLLAQKSHSYFDFTLYNYNIEDDHIPFLMKGVPVVHLISVPFPTVWHTARDDESILDYHTMHDVMKIMRVFVVDYMDLNVEN